MVISKLWKIKFKLRWLLSWRRALPDFMIIGEMKAGTTSLYEYLITHPKVTPALCKGTEYYNNAYRYGIDYYKTFFPIKKFMRGNITGEASVSNLFHPKAPERASYDIPEVRIIVMTREPIARAKSHWIMNAKDKKIEKLSFEKALEREKDEFDQWLEQTLSNPYQKPSWEFYNLTYMKRGEYSNSLRRWYEYFPKDQIMVVSLEELSQNTDEVYQNILKFLGLEEYHLKYYPVYNRGLKNDSSK